MRFEALTLLFEGKAVFWPSAVALTITSSGVEQGVERGGLNREASDVLMVSYSQVGTMTTITSRSAFFSPPILRVPSVPLSLPVSLSLSLLFFF